MYNEEGHFSYARVQVTGDTKHTIYLFIVYLCKCKSCKSLCVFTLGLNMNHGMGSLN